MLSTRAAGWYFFSVTINDNRISCVVLMIIKAMVKTMATIWSWKLDSKEEQIATVILTVVTMKTHQVNINNGD